jgi:hypothetical protein
MDDTMVDCRVTFDRAVWEPLAVAADAAATGMCFGAGFGTRRGTLT